MTTPFGTRGKLHLTKYLLITATCVDSFEYNEPNKGEAEVEEE